MGPFAVGFDDQPLLLPEEVEFEAVTFDQLHLVGAPEAEAWLNGRAYERGGNWIKFVSEATPPDLPATPDVKIYELGEDEADGEGLSSILAETLERPITAGTLFFSLPQEENWRCYTAALIPEEELVATGSMLIHDGVAQLCPGATLEHGRGRGCNTALLRRRLLNAIEAGCHTLFVELGEREPWEIAAAHRNFHRAGFKQFYASHNWQRPSLQPARVL